MTELTTLAHMLETGVAGPGAQAAASTRLRDQGRTLRQVIELIAKLAQRGNRTLES